MSKVVDIFTRDPVSEKEYTGGKTDYSFYLEEAHEVNEVNDGLAGIEITAVNYFSTLLMFSMDKSGTYRVPFHYGEEPKTVAHKLRGLADSIEKLDK